MATASYNQFKLSGRRGRDEQSLSAVTLYCHLSPKISAVTMEIRWFKETDCVCLYKNRQVIEGRGYEGRVSLFTQELQRGNVFLQIRDCRLSDRGDYLCQVTNGDTTEEYSVRVETDYLWFQLGRVIVSQWDRKWTEEERMKMEESVLLTASGDETSDPHSSLIKGQKELTSDSRHEFSDQLWKLDSAPQQLFTDTETFTPEMIDSYLEDKHFKAYRFVCPHAGQFQCRLTNLVFEMEGKGEVLYRIDYWDTQQLDGLGQRQPAGPLYKIDCFEGLISRLHLPHCEILSEGNEDGLSVAHFTTGNVEIVKPLKVTNTHVTIAVEGLSMFGLLSMFDFLSGIFSASPINGQVLLFYKLIPGRQNLRELHIHMLPGNVPLTEVKNQHMDLINIKTSSSCQLTPHRKYRPFCDPYVPQPTVEKFQRDYGPNYHPAFVVHAEAESITVSLLDEDATVVWEPRNFFLTGTETAMLSKNAGVEFVDKNRATLIQRVSSVMEIVDCLQSKNMLTKEIADNIKSAKPSQEQMRILYDALDSGGTAVKEEFYEVLKRKRSFLVKELHAVSVHSHS